MKYIWITMPKKRHNSGIFLLLDAYGVRSFGSEIKSNRFDFASFALHALAAYKHKKAEFVVLCLRVNIIQLLCQIMTKMGFFGVFGHGVVVFGRGLGYI